jgi:hypothetical protein
LKNKTRYDALAKEPTFQIGDLVLLYVPHVKAGKSRKFHHPWRGPYQILERTSPVNYRIRELTGNRRLTLVVHANRLKMYFPPPVVPAPNSDPNPPDQSESENDANDPGNQHTKLTQQSNNDDTDTGNKNDDAHTDANNDIDDPDSDSDATIIWTTPHPTADSDESSVHDEDTSDDEDTYPVEAILDDKLIGKTRHYLVKWENHDHSHNTWLPKQDVGLPLIQAYEKCKAKKFRK